MELLLQNKYILAGITILTIYYNLKKLNKKGENSRKLAIDCPQKVTAHESRAIAQYLRRNPQEIWRLNRLTMSRRCLT